MGKRNPEDKFEAYAAARGAGSRRMGLAATLFFVLVAIVVFAVAMAAAVE